MKTWKKALVPAALAISVLAPMSAFAADTGSADANSAAGKMPLRTMEHKLNGIHDRAADRLHRLAASVGPHHVMYIELLAEKYAPDTLDAWKTAFAERKQALEKLKPGLKDKAADAKRNAKETLGDLRDKLKNGEITREELRQKLQERLADRKANLEERKDDKEPEIEARRALHEQFTKAVDDQNAEEIRAVLPKLLEQYKHDTAKIVQKAEQLQAGQTPLASAQS